MITSNFFSRTISIEEAREGYILVPYYRVTVFPTVGQLFTLKASDKERIVKLESVRCTCGGGETPHEHYLIRWKGLEEGDHIVIEQNYTTPRLFKLSID